MLSEKRDVPYSTMIGWVRCRLSFALLRASIMSYSMEIENKSQRFVYLSNCV